MTTVRDRFTIFISYARDDGLWCEKVETQLKILTGRHIVAWSDTRIEVGNDWRAEIESALESACVAVLIVTAKFLASKFIMGVEVPKILKLQRKQGLTIYPLLVLPVPYELVTWLRRLQWRPSGKKCLSQMRPWEREHEFSNLVRDIKRIRDERRKSAQDDGHDEVRKPSRAAPTLDASGKGKPIKTRGSSPQRGESPASSSTPKRSRPRKAATKGARKSGNR